MSITAILLWWAAVRRSVLPTHSSDQPTWLSENDVGDVGRVAARREVQNSIMYSIGVSAKTGNTNYMIFPSSA